MTQSLTERLQERLATQSAEIERLTTSELKQLGERLRHESETALSSMSASLHAALETAMQPLSGDLSRLRRWGRWWWAALALTWLTMASLTALLLWLWMSPSGWRATWSGTASGTEGIAMYQTFRFEGRSYLLVPEGTMAVTCRRGEEQRPCLVLPMGEEPPVRPQARTDGS